MAARVLDLAAFEFGVMHPGGHVDSTAGYGIIITDAAVRELNAHRCECECGQVAGHAIAYRQIPPWSRGRTRD